MNLAILLLISCQTVAADPTQAAFEVTEKRLENFKESQAELGRISKILAQLGDPRKPQKGESVDAYFDRVDQIYRNRAHGLILLQMEYEEALTTRYELQADLKFYLAEISDKDKEFAAQQRQKLARKDDVRVRSVQLENELLAVQAVIYQAAGKEQKSLEEKKKALEKKKEGSLTWQEAQALAELNNDVRSCEAGYMKSQTNDDALALQRKYEKSLLPELRDVLHSLTVRAHAAKFEYQNLDYNLSPEQTAGAQKLLGERFGQIFSEADKTVKETTELEKRAAEVAVLAGEVRDNLRERATVRGFLARRKQLLEFMGGEDRRIESLRIIAGLPAETKQDSGIQKNMEGLWGKTSDNAAKENSTGKDGQDASPAPATAAPTAPALPKPSGS